MPNPFEVVFDKRLKRCGNCSHWTRYKAIGSSHMRFFGTCKKIDSQFDKTIMCYIDLYMVISNSPILMNQDMLCPLFEKRARGTDKQKEAA